MSLDVGREEVVKVIKVVKVGEELNHHSGSFKVS
jgi:hypothetical protein